MFHFSLLSKGEQIGDKETEELVDFKQRRKRQVEKQIMVDHDGDDASTSFD